MACPQLLRREVEETRSFSNGLLRTKEKAFGQVIQLWDGQNLLLAQDADQPSEFWRFGLVDSLVIYSSYGSANREDFLVGYLGSVTGTTLSDGSGSSCTRYKPFGSTYLGTTTQFYGIRKPKACDKAKGKEDDFADAQRGHIDKGNRNHLG